MPQKGTPSHTYGFKTSPKMKAKSYELRLTAQFGDYKSKRRLEAYNKRRKERMLEAGNKDYHILGKDRNRYWCMDYIVTQVSAGESLPSVCAIDGFPSVRQVYAWFKNHPDFEKAYREAEECRGHILGEEALAIMVATDRENVVADKAKAEFMAKFAARSNNRFQDKNVVQQVDELATLSTEQLTQRIKALLNANPELNTSFAVTGQALPGTPPPVLTYDAASQDPVEPDSPDEDA